MDSKEIERRWVTPHKNILRAKEKADSARYKKVLHILFSAFLLVLSVFLALPAEPARAQTAVISPNSGPVGTNVSVSGTGYTSNTTYEVIFAPTSSYQVTLRTGVVSANGTISDSFVVPQVPGGSYTVRVQTSTKVASDSFFVTPSLSLNTTSFRVGDELTVWGNGFGTSTTVAISFDGSRVASPSATTYGTFTASFRVPAGVAGSHTITASDTINSQSTTLSIVPFITLSPASAAPGTTVTVSGTGFAGSSSATITYGGSTVTTVPASLVTSSVGSFSVTFTVPPGTSNTVWVGASDGINMTSAIFTAIAGIRSNPATGNVNTEVTITGSGFNTNAQVTVSFDGIQMAQTNSDASGGFTVTFSVPASTGGEHTITANDSTNSVRATFTTQPAIGLAPSTGKVGTQITVTGSGFAASQETNVYFEDGLMATVSTDANGSFVALFNAPASTGGEHPVKASDGTNSASGPFATKPNLSVNPASGQTGAPVTISGTGFGGRQSVSIRFGDIQLKTITADANGNFSDRFTVPHLDAGSYNVTATDGANTVSVAFTLTTSFSINPTSGNVGSTVTVKGSGFSGTVTIKYDNTVVVTTAAGANGAISATFSVPASVHGDHIVAVNDTTTILQTVFIMESVPPPAPQLLAPLPGVRQSTRPTLAWQTVNDLSTVTYTLQIASDSTFTGIILQKQGLTAPEYTLTKAEKLAATKGGVPYYWRVKAIDLASNQGDWSMSGFFFLGFLPNWAKYALIGLGATIVALFVLWFGMVISRRRRSVI